MSSCVGHAVLKGIGVLRKKPIEAVLEEPKALPCWAVWLHSLAADTLTYSKISPLWQLWQPKRNLLSLIRSCNKWIEYALHPLIYWHLVYCCRKYVTNVVKRENIVGDLKRSFKIVRIYQCPNSFSM